MSSLFLPKNDSLSKNIEKQVQKEIRKTFNVEIFNLEQNTFKIPNNSFLQASTFLEIRTQETL